MLWPFIYSVLFIVAIYVWKFIKRVFKLKKNQKLKTLTVSFMVLNMVLMNMKKFDIDSFTDCLSINLSLGTIIFPLICNTFLFLGPIYQLILDDELEFKFKQHTLKSFTNLKKLIIAPLIEEITFRVLFFYIYSEFTQYRIYSSIFFSLAHINQGVRSYRKSHKIKKAVLSTVFIMMFTFVFGFYASTVFWETKSLISVTILHSYCNFMGFPQFQTIFQNEKINILKIICMYFAGILFFFYYI